MIKDNIQINIPLFNIKWSYIALIVVILFLGWATLKQWDSTKLFRIENKALKNTNKKLIVDYTVIKKQRIRDSLYIIESQIKIDSLVKSDKKHIRQLYNVNKKYEKLKTNYNSANSNDKWDIFTRAINN